MKRIGIIICACYRDCGGCPGGNVEYVPEEMKKNGTHPIPQRYLDAHEKLPFWRENDMSELVRPLLDESPEIKAVYN